MRKDAWKVTAEPVSAWVVKTLDRGMTALVPQCTHLGCAVQWDARGQFFLCQCHASRFSIDGAVVSGPAARPLDRYEVQRAGTKLLLRRSL
jgi:Rieske Fe-S protein